MIFTYRYVIMCALVVTNVVCFEGDFKSEENDNFGKDENFGIDENFGGNSVVQPSTNKNKVARCPIACKTKRDCCPGYKCERFYQGVKYGYCAKHCYPVGPGEDCRRCLECTSGFKCAILLSDRYVCLPRL